MTTNKVVLDCFLVRGINEDSVSFIRKGEHTSKPCKTEPLRAFRLFPPTAHEQGSSKMLPQAEPVIFLPTPAPGDHPGAYRESLEQDTLRSA